MNCSALAARQRLWRARNRLAATLGLDPRAPRRSAQKRCVGHGIHRAFLVLGGMTILSAIVFRELKRGDGDSVAASAHRIKGASLSIGAAGIAGIASELEQAGKSGELAGAAQLISTLDSELEPTRTALSAELAVELPD